MAIYKRDREFHYLFSQINVNVIPLRFVRDITCYLNNGAKIVLDRNDFSEDDLNDNHLENLVKNLTFYDVISDLKVRIDYKKVEEDVGLEVTKILNQ